MSDQVQGGSAAAHRLSRRNLWSGAGSSHGLRSLPRRDDVAASLWMLSAALAALGLTLVLQTFWPSLRTGSGQTMVRTACGLVGIVAALVLAGRLRPVRQLRDVAIVGALGALGVVNVALAAASTPLSSHPQGEWQWVALIANIAASVVLLCAVSWRVHMRQPPLPRPLLAGAVVLVVASCDLLLVASGRSGSVYTADALKLIAYALILAGCVSELKLNLHGLIQRAAADERRRMARDMHDGLAQELAFIATHSQRLGTSGDDTATVTLLKAAAERALHESRTTIAVLASPDDASLDSLIARTADSFRSKFGVEVDLDLQSGVLVDAERRNALLRILHEAMTNAIRHGRAEQVFVRLTAGANGPLLRIVDDGCGFDVPGAFSAAKGLGLMSMSERADMLGGGLNIFSSPGTGTVVEVGLP